jgi:hypothetical protein
MSRNRNRFKHLDTLAAALAKRLRVEDAILDGMHRRAGYSITSSASASSVGGTVRPRALAVLRLTTSSNLVGCSTGRSLALRL